ncbi:MAG TPA: asparagine synthase (glutamine-hydrolyzing) [Conexibacter sp.]|jgi:asparagine synthase (glutamine-hydrolysing)|nr:asparagine synthase (glutamine-hydrolyzing) [Conexibacter sp.]
MCGIGGIVRTDPAAPVALDALRRMAGALRHRGPDGWGMARTPGAGLVSTRLAIFDVPGGWQPMRAAGGALLVYNGEVYNHPELRAQLGGAFATTSDTEVVLRLLERDGLAALDRLNGQFALAWWDPQARRLTLVRDRFGVRPLHWAALPDGGIAFASEATALFAAGEVAAEPDLAGIDEVFTLWGPRAPHTAFRGVAQLPPGGLLVWERGRIVAQRTWWEPQYEPAALAGHAARAASVAVPSSPAAPRPSPPDPDELPELLADAVRLRLRADVPVGTYLSGGLDSSLITALARQASDHELRTFSVAFRDARYDERAFQQQVAQALGTRHHVVEVGPREIADGFRDAVAHAETPLIRTAPVPLQLLARATREQGITVVATGEGADELYWGYDLFKETAVRELHARDPERATALLDTLYPYLDVPAERRGPAWARSFFDAGSQQDPLFSHQPRIAATGIVKAFYRPEVTQALATNGGDPLARLRAALPAGFGRWSALERAAYLELTTLLAPYLLAAQGDRVAMAHGVEGRFPFLDHRVFEHSVRLPPERKLGPGLREKAELRALAQRLLPPEVAARTKQPYRAPEVAPFFGEHAPAWVEERLEARALDDVGIFDPARVAGLLRRCRAGKASGFREGMALVGILSTQVWHERFCGVGAGAVADRPAQSAGSPADWGKPRVLLDDVGNTDP